MCATSKWLSSEFDGTDVKKNASRTATSPGARLYYASLARNPSQIPVLSSEPEARYDVPVKRTGTTGLPWTPARRN